jgi:hypothetical protein
MHSILIITFATKRGYLFCELKLVLVLTEYLWELIQTIFCITCYLFSIGLQSLKYIIRGLFDHCFIILLACKSIDRAHFLWSAISLHTKKCAFGPRLYRQIKNFSTILGHLVFDLQIWQFLYCTSRNVLVGKIFA